MVILGEGLHSVGAFSCTGKYLLLSDFWPSFHFSILPFCWFCYDSTCYHVTRPAVFFCYRLPSLVPIVSQAPSAINLCQYVSSFILFLLTGRLLNRSWPNLPRRCQLVLNFKNLSMHGRGTKMSHFRRTPDGAGGKKGLLIEKKKRVSSHNFSTKCWNGQPRCLVYSLQLSFDSGHA